MTVNHPKAQFFYCINLSWFTLPIAVWYFDLVRSLGNFPLTSLKSRLSHLALRGKITNFVLQHTVSLFSSGTPSHTQSYYKDLAIIKISKSYKGQQKKIPFFNLFWRKILYKPISLCVPIFIYAYILQIYLFVKRTNIKNQF